jgi:hypothetical protein
MPERSVRAITVRAFGMTLLCHPPADPVLCAVAAERQGDVRAPQGGQCGDGVHAGRLGGQQQVGGLPLGPRHAGVVSPRLVCAAACLTN